jgi:hypothetical protein
LKIFEISKSKGRAEERGVLDSIHIYPIVSRGIFRNLVQVGDCSGKLGDRRERQRQLARRWQRRNGCFQLAIPLPMDGFGVTRQLTEGLMASQGL